MIRIYIKQAWTMMKQNKLFTSVFAPGRYPIVSDKYWVNDAFLHFGVVSMVTYLIILGISLVGTLITVLKAVKILPAEALRDE